MGTNWLAVDTNFPTFTGEENAKEQISAMLNYLYILKEQLQYSMRNLSLDNFSAAGLEQLSDSASKDLAEKIENFQDKLSQLSQEVDVMEAQISAAVQMGSRIEKTELEITYLQESQAETDERFTELEETAARQEQEIVQLQEQTDEQEAQIAGLQEDMDAQEQLIKELREKTDAAAGGITMKIGAEEPASGPVLWFNTTAQESEE